MLCEVPDIFAGHKDRKFNGRRASIEMIMSGSRIKAANNANKKIIKRSGRPQLTRSPHIRDLIIEKSANHLKSPTQISQELGIPRQTVCGIIKRFEKTGTIEYQSLGGDLRSIIQDHHRQFIINAVDENNTITLEELKTKLLEEFDDIHSISTSTLCNFLNNVERITLKGSTAMEEKRNYEETRRKRKKFISSLLREGILYNQNCIFIGEADFNISMIKGRSRSKAGLPAFVKTKTKRATSVTMLFALSAEGVESCHARVVKDDTTGLIFKEFVQQLVKKLDNANSGPCHLVMDNVRIHCNLSLRNWLQKRNKHKLKPLPPYSSFLNPVEECFSKLKNFVKKHPLDSEETLCERIKSSSYEITRQDCEGASQCISEAFKELSTCYQNHIVEMFEG
ncbi:Homeodomain-like DNA binding domain-containing transcription factor [Phycomyces blakesleeanus NRRL 1555(-)]|uniref:Homeodomain-like DNA binding domain-containing transcription factor n=1 Tax=Phycomyces blakesleeanus (strain ATCC 8743b / DSM 1359 / FGSC 10004 / NBRC 33097 / NRRL 1555) TaxID=763407 RepID=A0A167P748_PHYB8|nr:Homeodomain-like DNA binding domain-containing transcription factor [Phycomyces blakesleeanus NRRL 1555(-)]OAD77378.1 Homeodomain-like DNA binding domain-containing transcription factor [Phycomyces blakesleeanus NRRL 1555(-)]|eukprot:XP_018295418.1 Homeodomain-like DNA binding domain-containing transcription factor [Phycomyces blakesleeanus NRRL 1555(-)]